MQQHDELLFGHSTQSRNIGQAIVSPGHDDDSEPGTRDESDEIYLGSEMKSEIKISLLS
ncbi:hypothetical protein BVRB_040440 [Beta vulgaris subsp. vulgaris]|uniref:Uncharacterized protein n=1 Tax=Beta vulgaris subsp. vulgaris TaxID=3555 RepID=A0A0J7YPF1_BETVV|nr:hypothetical protein BVRB_040440 [Beta vulgaris subsp. vulgaris]